MVQQSASAVTDFTGLLIQADSASHAFLNLRSEKKGLRFFKKIISIILGTGVVTGSLTGTGGVIQVRYFPLIGQYLLLILSSDSQVLRLVLGSDLSNSTHQVPLTPGLVCRDNQVR